MDNLKVLLVDDEEDFLETMSKRLARRAMDVSTAVDCLEAIRELEQKSMDVVILDVALGELDGILCLKRIKARWPSLSCIMLTGHASINMAIEGMEAGAFDYCMKPVELDALVERIQIAYEHSQGE